MEAPKRPDVEELRANVPLDLFTAIDAIARAEGTTKTELVNRWLAECVRKDLHAASLKTRMTKGNAFAAPSERDGGAD